MAQGDVARWNVNFPDGALSFGRTVTPTYNARKMAARGMNPKIIA